MMRSNVAVMGSKVSHFHHSGLARLVPELGACRRVDGTGMHRMSKRISSPV